jgi:hypothetical protein
MSKNKTEQIVIGPSELGSIKLAALRVFHETHHLPEDSKEAQIFMICEALHSFLISKGIVPQFRVKPVREDYGDTTPLDDIG